MNHANDHKLLCFPRWLAIPCGQLLAAQYIPDRDIHRCLFQSGLHYDTDADMTPQFEADLLALLGPVDTPTSPIITIADHSYLRADHIAQCGIAPNGQTFVRLHGLNAEQHELVIELPLADLIAKTNKIGT